MSKDESDYKSELVKAGRAFGDYARRLEDRYTVGMPDILYAPKDSVLTLLIEAKLVTGGILSPSPRQGYELDLWNKSGKDRLGLVLGFEKDIMYLTSDLSGAKIGLCARSDPGEPFYHFIRRFLK